VFVKKLSFTFDTFMFDFSRFTYTELNYKTNSNILNKNFYIMKNKNHTEEEILEKVEIESSRIDINDVEKIVSKENRINEKSSKFDLNRFNKLIKQIKLALSLMKDFKNKQYTQVPWRTIALISAAILYFINPFDVVPDMLPFFGITDDAFLFLSVFKSIQTDLEKYGEWKGIDTKEYF